MKTARGLLVALAAWFALCTGFASAAALAAPPVIVALGDSLTAGYGLQSGSSFPAQLQKALEARGQDVDIVNAGVSGDTASDGLARFDWSVPQNAGGLILELGANDALRGLDPAKTKAALEAILDKAKARGLPVLLAGMEAPRNLGKEYDAQFHALYAALAQRYDVVFYPFFLQGVALNEALTLDDGMHPNPQGVAVIVKAILPSVEKLLDQVTARRRANGGKAPKS
jgi:acyl-CoA thioesterase I